MTQREQKSLFIRQRILLALIQVFGGRLSKINLQKYLFLYTTICQSEKSYEFVPYRFGCFSFQSYADRRRLIEVGAIKPVDRWELADVQTDYLAGIPSEERKKLILFKQKYGKLGRNDLVREIYREFPYYATKSEIADQLMTKNELKKIDEAKPNATGYAFFTIGYEGQSFENYLNRLLKNNVHVLCDVRKNPLSRKYGFSKSTLSDTLNKLGIEYIHIPDLGIVSEKRRELKSQSDYDRLFDDYETTTLAKNEESLEKLHKIFAQFKRVAITCFEADHCMCHRSRVAKAMSQRPGWKHKIIHI